jgi:hypothetical protein
VSTRTTTKSLNGAANQTLASVNISAEWPDATTVVVSQGQRAFAETAVECVALAAAWCSVLAAIAVKCLWICTLQKSEGLSL